MCGCLVVCIGLGFDFVIVVLVFAGCLILARSCLLKLCCMWFGGLGYVVVWDCCCLRCGLFCGFALILTLLVYCLLFIVDSLDFWLVCDNRLVVLLICCLAVCVSFLLV